jgi:hypothetical protein
MRCRIVSWREMRRPVYLLLGLVAIAALVASGCGEKSTETTAGAASTVRVPHFPAPRYNTLSLFAAYDRLHEAGLKVAIRNSFSIQSNVGLSSSPPEPRQGSVVPRGSVVTIGARSGLLGSLVYWANKPPPSEKIPDFVGGSPTGVRRWADSRDIYWRIQSLPALPAGDRPHLLDNYVVVKQSPAPGTVLRSWRTWISVRVALRPAN